MKIYSFTIAFLVTLMAFGQTHKGELSTIKSNGLYKIELPQNVRSAARDNFDFLRLKDLKNQQVPYVLMDAKDETFSTFTALKTLSKTPIKDSITSIIVSHNLNSLNALTLRITNTKVNKTYTIYGSHNKTDWFGLVANKDLRSLNATSKTFVKKTIELPLNTYKFIKINLNDKLSIPINVLNVGINKSAYFKQELTKLEGYTQTRSLEPNNSTRITFTAKEASKIDAISFNSDTQYFLRQSKISIEKKRRYKKTTETYNQVLKSFQLNSKNNNTISFYRLNNKEFYLDINNQDNPELSFKAITLLQKPKYIVANLMANETYSLEIDTTLQKPNYDLKNFVNNTTTKISDASISNFKTIEKTSKATADKPFWETNLFMWLCIILGGIIVTYFALSLLKDMSKTN